MGYTGQRILHHLPLFNLISCFAVRSSSRESLLTHRISETYQELSKLRLLLIWKSLVWNLDSFIWYWDKFSILSNIHILLRPYKWEKQDWEAGSTVLAAKHTTFCLYYWKQREVKDHPSNYHLLYQRGQYLSCGLFDMGKKNSEQLRELSDVKLTVNLFAVFVYSIHSLTKISIILSIQIPKNKIVLMQMITYSFSIQGKFGHFY